MNEMLPMAYVREPGTAEFYEVVGPAGRVSYMPLGNCLKAHPTAAARATCLAETDADLADNALRQYGRAGLRLYLNRWYDRLPALFADEGAEQG